VIFYSRNT